MTAAELTGSESKLWQLVADRSLPGADTDAIDATVWETFGQHWTVMATDLSGFSRHVREFGIMHFLQVIHQFKVAVRPAIEAHRGVLIKAEADSLLLLFTDPHEALECAIAMQRACHAVSAGRPAEEQVILCVGLGHGPVLRIGETDVFGAEVNGACKLGEDTAGAHEVLVTRAFRDAYTGDAGFEPIYHDIAGVDIAFQLVYDL